MPFLEIHFMTLLGGESGATSSDEAESKPCLFSDSESDTGRRRCPFSLYIIIVTILHLITRIQKPDDFDFGFSQPFDGRMCKFISFCYYLFSFLSYRNQAYISTFTISHSRSFFYTTQLSNIQKLRREYMVITRGFALLIIT